MNKLQNILAYLCERYPHKGELSKARLTKLVYLADWFSALSDNKQMTDIEWLFNHYGPYVDDITLCAQSSDQFKITTEQTAHGSMKYLIQFHGVFQQNSLSEREQQILDVVINKTKHMYFNDFIDYVYSTYPVQSKDRYSYLNLISLANEYKTTLTN
tara:strand:- start:304 stop:774 length:471 start_codon:yes stop_codon:yes gene_type:complete